MKASGALMRPADFPAFEAAPPTVVGDILESWPIAEAAGRWVLAPPAYDLPWRTGAAAAAGWPTELLRDPRRRGGAGLGAWCAIDQQDQLADGARRQAGAIDAAAHDFRDLSFGLAAGTSLFTNRLPPGSSRASGGARTAAAAAAVAAKAALLIACSAAEHRECIPRSCRAPCGAPFVPARRCSASAPGLTVASVLAAANRCPDEERPSPFTDALHANAGHPTEVGWSRRLGAGSASSAVSAAARRRRDARSLARCAVSPRAHGAAMPARRPCGLGDTLATRVGSRRAPTPRRSSAFANATTGIVDPLPAPVFEPELDLPLAPVLAKLAPQWLLPGRGSLADTDRRDGVESEDSSSRRSQAPIIARSAELRWRNVRIRSGWSPLRRFWPRPTGPDITPLRAWSRRSRATRRTVRPGDVGESARRRHPLADSAAVSRVRAMYLLDPSVDVKQLHRPELRRHRRTSAFCRSSKAHWNPDLHYIGFPRTAAQAAEDHYLVLEEPMAEPRFRLEPPCGDCNAWQNGDPTRPTAQSTPRKRSTAEPSR